MHARRVVNLEEFRDGKTAFLTRGFITYNVKFIESNNRRVLVEVTEALLVHKKAMQKAGISKCRRYAPGTKLLVDPENLWEVLIEEKTSLWAKIWNKIAHKDMQ